MLRRRCLGEVAGFYVADVLHNVVHWRRQGRRSGAGKEGLNSLVMPSISFSAPARPRQGPAPMPMTEW
jgi:hypothetical protein